MTISEVRIYSTPLATSSPYNMSSPTLDVPQSTIVELVDSDGVRGYGEVCLASPHYQPAHEAGVVASLSLLAPAVLGLDPVQHSLVNAAMHAALDGCTEGKSAIDIACWDLTGKRYNRHVAELLGGPMQTQVMTYHVIGIVTPEAAATEATRLQEEGLRRLQLKAGGRSIDQDIACIHAVARTLRPDTELAVDANRGWSTAEAIQVSSACADVRLSLEQPCATEAEMQQIKVAVRHPLILDESATDLRSIARQISYGVADGFGLKISRIGGLTAMRAVRDLCMATRTPMSSDDAWGGDILAAAGVALGATLQPKLNRGAWIAHPYHQVHYDVEHGPRIGNGRIALPGGGPGLGLVIAEGAFGDPIAVYGPASVSSSSTAGANLHSPLSQKPNPAPESHDVR